MKPLNLDNRPCSPVSSNCVVWQGPTISCINICNGDTVSDVVAALATELCTLLDQTNVSNYDLTCLGISACGPKDFQALIQLLIDKICELNGITPETGKVTGGCPDCLVSVAPCFQVGNQTNMQLLDYVQMIAEKVCAIIDEIASINIQISNLDDRVTILENTPPPVFTLPSILVDCTLSASILGGNSYTIDLVLDALVNDDTYGYCSLLGSTGLPADLASAVASACITATTPTINNAPTPYGTQYLGSWVNTPTTVADSINNIWLVLCDYYDYLQNSTIAVADTTTVNLEYTSGVLTAYVQDTGWVDLLGFNHYSTDPTMTVGRPQVRRIGNVVHFRGSVIIPLEDDTDPGTVVTWLYKSGENTYEGVLSSSLPAHGKKPFTGSGGVTISASGGLRFNNGNSVIPTAVLPTGYVLDNNYSFGWRLNWRAMNTGSCNTVLTSFANVGIAPNGSLVWGCLADLEESFVSGCRPGAFSTSALNYAISNVTQGQQVTDFKSAVNVHDSALTGNQNAQPFFKTTEEYPISINANDVNEIGGFWIVIDGLTGFISPCVTVIPTPEPCP
jgi:hypothetical protein